MAIEMGKYEAEQLLGLTGTYDKNALSRAYREKVREYHPDLARARGEDGDVAEEMMTQVNAAKAYLDPLFEHKSTITCSPAPGTGAAKAGAAAATGAAAGSAAKTGAEGSAASRAWTDPLKTAAEDPYGGWGEGTSMGQAYYEGRQRVAEATERIAQDRQRWYDEVTSGQKRWETGSTVHSSWVAQNAAERIDPVDQFRWHDGPMPEHLADKYDKVQNFHYRLVFALVCFIWASIFIFYELIVFPPDTPVVFTVSALLAMFLLPVNLITGWVTNPIRDARLRKLDRELAKWRAVNPG